MCPLSSGPAGQGEQACARAPSHGGERVLGLAGERQLQAPRGARMTAWPAGQRR